MLNKKFTVFDFETTGVDPLTCSVVSFAAVEYCGEVSCEYYQEYDCEGEIPELASAVHGLTKEYLEGKEYFKENNEAINILNDSEWIVGYNNFRYDNKIAKRYGMKFKPCVDVYILIKSNLKELGMQKAGKLGEMYTHFTGNDPENSHNALGDCLMTHAILVELCKILGEDKVFVDKTERREPATDFMLTIGKYKGVKNFSEVVKEDYSYAIWLYQNCDFYKQSDFYLPIMKKHLGF